MDSLASEEQALGSVAIVASFNPSTGQLPESVTADDRGNFYLSMANTVQRLSPAGQLSLYAQLPISPQASAGGVKFGPDGALYVATSAFDPTLNASGVYRISREGAVSQYAALDPTGFPNDLAFDEDGNLFVTDPFLGQLWKIPPHGQPSVWLKDPLLAGDPQNPALVIHAFGADGIAFDRDQRYLYVGNLDHGAIVRIEKQLGCRPGTPQTFVADSRLRGADGIAFDQLGRLYVAVNAQDQLARVGLDRSVTLLAQGSPLDGPSSLVFGHGFEDARTLYIANFAISRAFGLQPGTPHPSLAKIAVPVGGLELP